MVLAQLFWGKKGLPDFIDWKNRDALIVHSDKGIETHRSAIGESLITPNSNIYIRNKMPVHPDLIDLAKNGDSDAVKLMMKWGYEGSKRFG